MRSECSVFAEYALAKAKPYINGFEMIQGTMDDVFLNITGKTLGAGSGEGL